MDNANLQISHGGVIHDMRFGTVRGCGECMKAIKEFETWKTRMASVMDEIAFNTRMSKGSAETTLERTAKFLADVDSAKRLEEQKCPTCYYIRSTLAGQAFTEYKCLVCEQNFNHPNTNIPECCLICAKECNICQQCGGEMFIPSDLEPFIPEIVAR